MIACSATTFVLLYDYININTVDYIADNSYRMIIGNQILQARRKQINLILLIRLKKGSCQN